MFQASFIFRSGAPDGELHRVASAVAEEAAQMESVLSEVSWTSGETGLRNAVYDWRGRPSRDAFARAATHRAAKRQQQARWHDGCHVNVAEIVAAYGDGRLARVAGNAPRRKRQGR